MDADGGVKKPRKRRRARPGTKARREVKQQQKSTKRNLPRAVMFRIVKELSAEFASNGRGFRLQRAAVEVALDGAESFVVDMATACSLITRNAKRTTLMQRDVDTLVGATRIFRWSDHKWSGAGEPAAVSYMNDDQDDDDEEEEDDYDDDDDDRMSLTLRQLAEGNNGGKKVKIAHKKRKKSRSAFDVSALK